MHQNSASLVQTHSNGAVQRTECTKFTSAQIVGWNTALPSTIQRAQSASIQKKIEVARGLLNIKHYLFGLIHE